MHRCFSSYGFGQPLLGWTLALLAVGLGLLARAASPVLAAPGDLDPRFGTAGRVATDFGGGEFANAIAIQKDGKIVLVGSILPGGTVHFAMARYLKSGAPDP